MLLLGRAKPDGSCSDTPVLDCPDDTFHFLERQCEVDCGSPKRITNKHTHQKKVRIGDGRDQWSPARPSGPQATEFTSNTRTVWCCSSARCVAPTGESRPGGEGFPSICDRVEIASPATRRSSIGSPTHQKSRRGYGIADLFEYLTAGRRNISNRTRRKRGTHSFKIPAFFSLQHPHTTDHMTQSPPGQSFHG